MQPEPFSSRPPREPMFNVPGIILASIAILVGLHLVVGNLDPRTYFDVIFGFGFVPGAWTAWLSPETVETVLRQARDAPGMAEGMGLALAQFALVEVSSGPWSLLTYALLHGSWAHVLLNAFWLAAFGTPVARRLGTGRFLLLCVVTALGGAFAHWLTHIYDITPMIGASGVVSGMMGAAAWFVFSSSSAGGLIDRYAHLKRRETLASMVRNRQTMVFFGIWFALNFLFGIAAAPLGLTEGGIAWQAHIGGFLAGLAVFPMMDPFSRRQPG
ncbi:MAG TPA: rhomboid family intramembrane serine protease [Saliniramus sp.]|nr:rhomboid family intramembrane serine protease [Saliniramus sp.]